MPAIKERQQEEDMKYHLVFFALLINFFSSSTCLAADPLDHKITVENITFQWTVVDDHIKISLSAKTEGWVAVGFNPSRAMKDANLILGYVKEEKATITDHFGVTKHQHKSDEKLGGKNNITDISGTEEKGITTINFTIPLDSGDDNDPVISTDAETTVLLAYSTGRDSFRTRHKFRTSLKVNLKTGNYNRIK